MQEYEVKVIRVGYMTVEAENEDEATTAALDIGPNGDIDWCGFECDGAFPKE